MEKTYYLIAVEGGVEPFVRGHSQIEEERDNAAKQLRINLRAVSAQDFSRLLEVIPHPVYLLAVTPVGAGFNGNDILCSPLFKLKINPFRR